MIASSFHRWALARIQFEIRIEKILRHFILCFRPILWLSFPNQNMSIKFQQTTKNAIITKNL